LTSTSTRHGPSSMTRSIWPLRSLTSRSTRRIPLRTR